jgi:hypothetical protein
VVVLRIRAEVLLDEGELGGGDGEGAEEGDEEATVVPDLVGFEVLGSDFVHE